jgi:hypothetical protein
MKLPELNQDDYDLLLIALGMATGVAAREGNAALANRVLRLANTINADNPNWTPYAVEEVM